MPFRLCFRFAGNDKRESGQSCTNSGTMKNIARIYLRLWKVIRGAKKGGDLLAEVGKRKFRNTPASLSLAALSCRRFFSASKK